MSDEPIVAVAAGAAGGSLAAAAALACAGSDPDRAGLLIAVGGRPPRPTLLASAAARALEERLASHLPGLRAAARGLTCQLGVPDDEEALGRVRAALPLARGAVAVVHLPPARLQGALGEGGLRPRGVLLRADLDRDRALAALAARDLVGRGLRVKVLREALAWVPARRALFGALPGSAPGGLPASVVESLLQSHISAVHACYSEADDQEADPAGTAQQERRGDAGPGRGGGLHRHPQREAGR